MRLLADLAPQARKPGGVQIDPGESDGFEHPGWGEDFVIINLDALVNGFYRDVVPRLVLPLPDGLLRHQAWPAPHTPPPLLPGAGAVYVFSLSATYGSTCSAGPHCVLKVGIAGPASNS